MRAASVANVHGAPVDSSGAVNLGVRDLVISSDMGRIGRHLRRSAVAGGT